MLSYNKSSASWKTMALNTWTSMVKGTTMPLWLPGFTMAFNSDHRYQSKGRLHSLYQTFSKFDWGTIHCNYSERCGFFGTIEQLHLFSSALTHRWKTFKQFVAGKTVKWVCETKWSFKRDAIDTVWSDLEETSEAREQLRDSNAETQNTVRCRYFVE